MSAFDISGTRIMNSPLLPALSSPPDADRLLPDDLFTFGPWPIVAAGHYWHEEDEELIPEREPIDPAVLIALHDSFSASRLSQRLLQRGIPDTVWEVIEALGRLREAAARINTVLQSYDFEQVQKLNEISMKLKVAEELLMRLSELPASDARWGDAHQAVRAAQQLVIDFRTQLELGVSEISSYARESGNLGIVAEVKKWTSNMANLSEVLSQEYVWEALYSELLDSTSDANGS